MVECIDCQIWFTFSRDESILYTLGGPSRLVVVYLKCNLEMRRQLVEVAVVGQPLCSIILSSAVCLLFVLNYYTYSSIEHLLTSFNF